MSNQEELLAYLLLKESEEESILLSECMQKEKSKVNSMLENRNKGGCYNILVNRHLLKGERKFREFFRVKISQFSYLLDLIKDGITKNSPNRYPYKALTKNQCTPLSLLAYRHRGAGAVIHTHSQRAVMATLLCPGNEFRCSHLEMIKGIYDQELGRYLRYDEELVVPIIENTPFEKDITDEMYNTMMKYPGSSAVLVRRHGVYVWGSTWQKAKTMAECYDYLFSVAVEMKKCGLDPTASV